MKSGLMHNKMPLKIQTFPRIHLTLIGMNNDGYRINGGAGFSLSFPYLICYFEESEIVEINDLRKKKFTNNEKKKLKLVVEKSIKEFNLHKSIKCTITGEVFPHYGLGSSTSVYLACIEALFIINGFKYDRETVVSASTRGGTSGIGTNTYFDGGFVFDIGVRSEEQLLLPSSIANRKGKKTLVLKQSTLPNWQIGLCFPAIINKSEKEEIDFFNSNCPIKKNFVEEILYEVVYGITASILELNYKDFCRSVNSIQLTKWKALERSIYGADLFDLENKIKLWGADCVGMSSLGPILFFTGKNLHSIINNINKDFSLTSCYIANFNNKGRIITYD